MNTQQEQAYIEGFVKRASEYGFDENQAMDLLKSAFDVPDTLAGLPSLTHTALKGIGKAHDKINEGLGNYIANRPRLHQGLESYVNNYNTAINGIREAIPQPSAPSLTNFGIKNVLAPIAANGVAAYKTLK